MAKSPQNATPSLNYERGWNAINELIRSDSSWSGSERNVFYLNNGDGTFSEVSGTVGLDFPDDSRSFALADVDHDGRLEIVLKNRNAPQTPNLAQCDEGPWARDRVPFTRNQKQSRRDRSSHNNRGGGTSPDPVSPGRFRISVTALQGAFLWSWTRCRRYSRDRPWPSGLTQVFDNLPANHRIEIAEGSDKVSVKPFAASPQSYETAGDAPSPEPLPSLVETWLIDPLNAPDFSLPDLAGKTWRLGSFRGSFLLLNFWTTTSPACVDQMRLLQLHQSALSSSGLRIVGIIIGSNADEPNDSRSLQSFLDKDLGRNKNTPSFPLLLGHARCRGGLQHHLSLPVRPAPGPCLAHVISRRSGRHDRKGLSGPGEPETAGGGC